MVSNFSSIIQGLFIKVIDNKGNEAKMQFLIKREQKQNHRKM